MKKVIYIDTETTGLDKVKHGLRELAYIVEIDGEEVESGLFKINPLTYNKEVEIDPKALEISKKTLEDLTGDEYTDSRYCFSSLIELLDKYIDKFNKEDKFIINGYNTSFDIGFIQEWFTDNNNKFYGAYFNYKDLDVFALVKYLKYLGYINTKNDKLETICNHFDIDIAAHNALDDIKATKKLNDLLTRRYLNEEKQEKDPLHQLNSLIRDYCLKREFDKRYPHKESWFSIQIMCTGRYTRVALVRPLVKDSFFERKFFGGDTTKEMFEEAMTYYKLKLEER
jgi:DNA polymerase-3 subunit epsilon